MNKYLFECENLHRVVLLTDASVGLLESDKILIEMLGDLKKQFIVAMTKADKVKNPQHID